MRKAVSDVCRDYGLLRVQRSVFFGELDRASTKKLKEDIEDRCRGGENDSVFILPVCESCMAKKHVMGRSFEETKFLSKNFYIYG